MYTFVLWVGLFGLPYVLFGKTSRFCQLAHLLHDSPCCFNNFDATTGNGQTKVTHRTKSDPRASRPTPQHLVWESVLLYMQIGFSLSRQRQSVLYFDKDSWQRILLYVINVVHPFAGLQLFAGAIHCNCSQIQMVQQKLRRFQFHCHLHSW